GVVVKTGANVKHIKVGDRVVYGQSPLGAYSEIHNVPEEKLAILPDGISFETAAACFMKGLTAFYLLRKTYEVKAGEVFLFHAAAGGVGQIACQWAKALGAKMIGTVGSDEKAQKAKAAGAWETINYNKEDIVERVLALTDGEKVGVVYDSVGKDTWLPSLDCLKRRGLMVSYGNASGPVTGVDLGILNKKGSLYVTRPSVFGYITNREELNEASKAIFDLILSGKLTISIPADQVYPLKDAALAHKRLEGRATTGSSILIP
ncbi:NADPH:quinone reductase, partial [Morganella morganii]